MLQMPILRTPFEIDNGRIDTIAATDKAFKHNISKFGKGRYLSEDLLKVIEVADDSKYIILPTGEYYDVSDGNVTTDHILRRNLDVSVGEFYIHDEDPNLGLIEIEQHEKNILTSDSLYDTPYVGNLTYLDYRDNFWNSDVEIVDEIVREYVDGLVDIEANEGISEIDKGQYGEISTYDWMKPLTALDTDNSNLDYNVELTYKASSTEKALIHSGDSAFGKFSGNKEILSMGNSMKIWSKDGLSKVSDTEIEVIIES